MLLRFINFLLACVCVRTRTQAHMWAWKHMLSFRFQKRMSELLEMELQEVLNDQTWVLRSEFQSSGKVVSVPNHCALSLVPSSPCFKDWLGRINISLSLNKWKLDTILKRKKKVFIFKIGKLRLSCKDFPQRVAGSRKESNRVSSLKFSVTAVRRSIKGRIRDTNTCLNQKEKKINPNINNN